MTTAHRSSITAIAGVDGFRHLALGDVGSTNSEALSLAKDGDNGRLWVTGTTQSAGRARRGRSWVSESGNLYASLLLVDPAGPEHMSTLPLVVSLALHTAVADACPELGDRLKIKWPNDLLLDGKKLSGILIEAQPDGFGRLAVIIGCGVNCKHYPDNPLYPATSLLENDIRLEPLDLFQHLAGAMAQYLRIWAQGHGFAIIRKEWLERCHGLGETIVARFTNDQITGTFQDLDEAGLLLLCDNKGRVHKISAADIFL